VETDTIVIGAGPAGLAVGACLGRVGVPCLILEQSDQVGSSWRHHYDRLHLHTDRANSALPFAPLPRDYPRYPSRLQVIEYLEAYTRQFHLPIRFGQQVVSAHRENARWAVRTQEAEYAAPNLVVAAGYNREPYAPSWPGRDSFPGTILHSAEDRNGEPFKGQNVLVVGFGNSGGEIAIDLCENGAHTCMSVRGPVNVIPRELFGIPILTIGILESWLPLRLVDALNGPILGAVIGDLTRYGLRRLPHGPLAQITGDGHIPLIDIGTIRLIKQGRIAVYPGIERFDGPDVMFTDGRKVSFDAAILATGFRPKVDAFLEDAGAALGEDGMPLSSGREAAISGLYFCGYRISPSGMLREIAREAQRISADIAGKRG